MTLSKGTRLGPYQVERLLGTGGMGEVYRARDTTLNRDVAIKVLLPAVTADPERLSRFSREAQVLASLNHPHIAQIYGLEDAGGVPPWFWNWSTGLRSPTGSRTEPSPSARRCRSPRRWPTHSRQRTSKGSFTGT